MHVYFRELMQLEISRMPRIMYDHCNIIPIDSDESSHDSDAYDAKNADDDCQHEICHRVACKFEKSVSDEPE